MLCCSDVMICANVMKWILDVSKDVCGYLLCIQSVMFTL